jgi:hypothetical protein
MRSALTRIGRVLGCTAVLALVSTGCSAPSNQYLGDQTSGVIVQIPKSWKVIESAEMLAVTANRVPQADTAALSRWLYGFSADSTAVGETILQLGGTKPSGMVRSRYFLNSEIDGRGWTVTNLLNSLNDMAILPGGGNISSRQGGGVYTNSGVNGVRYTLELTFPDGKMTVQYVAVVDILHGQLNTLIIGCSSECYSIWSAEINRVAESFTVMPPKP